MPKLTHTLEKPPHPLDPNIIIRGISGERAFLDALPNHDVRTLSEEELREKRQLAIARGAIAVAERKEEEIGTTSLSSNLFKLVGNLNAFYDGDRTLDTLLEEYDNNPRHMPRVEKNAFYSSKDDVIKFNHVLQDVLKSAGPRPKFDFTDLLSFMTLMYTRGGGTSTRDFENRARIKLIGMRNEVETKKVLKYGGIDYADTTLAEEKEGGDLNVGNVLIDLKASRMSALHAKKKAIEQGRNPETIVWSHMEFEDFSGGLILPKERYGTVLTAIKPDIEAAVTSERRNAVG